MNKPSISSASTVWRLNNESAFKSPIEDNIEDKNALVEVVDNIIKDKTSIPELTNNLLYYISESEGLEESIAKEIAILQERKARFRKRSDNLRESIKMVFDRFDIKKMECPYGTISQVTRRASKLNVLDEGEILMNYPDLYERQEPKLNRSALKDLLESGVVIDGVELLDTQTIMIRK